MTFDKTDSNYNLYKNTCHSVLSCVLVCVLHVTEYVFWCVLVCVCASCDKKQKCLAVFPAKLNCYIYILHIYCIRIVYCMYISIYTHYILYVYCIHIVIHTHIYNGNFSLIELNVSL